MSFPDELDISRGGARGLSSNHKFGRNPAVGTSFVPITQGGVYRTPQPFGATKLRIRAGDADDAPAGSGARSVLITGLDASGNEVSEVIETNGASAGPSSQNEYIRLYRAFVYESGSYATTVIRSHAGEIVIENEAGTEDWATIADTDIGRGQSQIAVYSVPVGYKAYIRDIVIASDSAKKINMALYQRRDILQESPPYSSMRIIEEYTGISGAVEFGFAALLGPYPALTDIGFLGRVTSGTADVSASFDLILEYAG